MGLKKILKNANAIQVFTVAWPILSAVSCIEFNVALNGPLSMFLHKEIFARVWCVRDAHGRLGCQMQAAAGRFVQIVFDQLTWISQQHV